MSWQYLLEKSSSFISQSFTLFWKRHPALWTALSITFGLTTVFITALSLIPLILLLVFLPRNNKVIALVIATLSLLFAKTFYTVPEKESHGQGTVTISSYSPAKYGGWLYRGTLHSFTSQDFPTISPHLPCRIFSETFYDPEFEYKIEAILKKRPDRSFVTLKSKKPWIKTKKLFNLVQKRSAMKSSVADFLSQNLKNSNVSSFFSALVTGVTQDDIQAQVFARLGLAHLFAVSGFHFALFAFGFHFFLRLFLPKKVEAICLTFILTLFLLFLGPSPSVLRAWFTAIFALIALVVEKEKRSLNTFGLSLLFVILINPYAINDLSFQLSFLATAGILLFYTSFDNLLQSIFPKEPIYITLQKSLKLQYLQIVSTWFRKALALNFAVHLTLLPMQVSIFSKFPWHSLIYNLFFPFLVSIALFFLLISFSLTMSCPWIGKVCFCFTNWYTKMILWITEYPPFPQKTWYIEKTFPGFTPLMLSLIFFIGILWQHYWEQKRQQNAANFLFF